MATKNILAVKKIQDNVDRVNALDHCFCEMFSRDSDFYIKFLFATKNKFQIFIKSYFYNSAGQGRTVRYLNFNALFDMLESKYLSVNLPILLTTSLQFFVKHNWNIRLQRLHQKKILRAFTPVDRLKLSQVMKISLQRKK